MGISSSTQESEINALLSSVSEIVNSVYSKNSSTIRTAVNNTQNIIINVKGDVNCAGGFEVTQNINSSTLIVNNVTATMSSELTNKLGTELESKTESIMKLVRDLGGGLGADDVQKVTQNIKQQVLSIIQNTTTQENLQDILSQAVNIQNQEININGNLLSQGTCIYTQNILVDMQASGTANALSNNIFNDEILTRIMNDAKTSAENEQKGVTDLVNSISQLISSLSLPMMLGIAALLIGSSFVMKSIPPYVWGLMIALVVGLIIYNLITKKKSTSEYWGCEKTTLQDGKVVNTGQCIQYTDAENGPFSSYEKCLNARMCPQYWKCNPETQTCVQGSNVFEGPKENETTCNMLCDKNSVVNISESDYDAAPLYPIFKSDFYATSLYN